MLVAVWIDAGAADETALRKAARAVFGKLPDIEIPGADEAAVEIHPAGAVGRGAVRAESVEKR